MKKTMLTLAALFLTVSMWAQNTCGPSNPKSICSNGPTTVTVSGTPIQLASNGGLVPALNYVWGTVSTGTVTTQGCVAQICDPLDSYTGGNTNRTVDNFSVKAPTAPYEYFIITPTWAGGGSFTVKEVNNNTARYVKPGSGGGGDTITSPNSTLAVGGTSTNTTLDVIGAAGEVLAGATPALTYSPTLGAVGHQGSLNVAGATSGTATITTQAAAGTPTLTLGTSSGTPAVTASSPLVITAATGNITCPTCGVTGSPLSQFASTTSAQLLGVLSNPTGTGLAVFGTSPTLSNPVVGTQTSTDNSTLGASTAFVATAISNAVAGTNPAVAVKAATTQASDTSGLTYNNGVSGVGATLTGSVNTAITFDGQALTAVNQRVLVKNDTQSPSGAFNGVYFLTQLQTGILPPILTRALDYNSPSDINNTGAVPVVSGTVNANTSWLLTSAVSTVGTDPLTYVQFTIAPTLMVVNNAANTGTTAMTLDMSASTGATAFKVPVIAGATSGANGVIDYDSTAKSTKIRTNNADSVAAAYAANPAGSKCAQTSGTTGLLTEAVGTCTTGATTDTFTNKTFDTAGTGNSFLINGLAATANTGTGAVVRAVSPALTGTPTIGGVAVSSMATTPVVKDLARTWLMTTSTTLIGSPITLITGPTTGLYMFMVNAAPSNIGNCTTPGAFATIFAWQDNASGGVEVTAGGVKNMGMQVGNGVTQGSNLTLNATLNNAANNASAFRFVSLNSATNLTYQGFTQTTGSAGTCSIQATVTTDVLVLGPF